MSQPPTSQPPDPPAAGTASRVPPAPSAASRAIEGTVANLRAELAGTTDRTRQARILGEVGELEERAGDEPGAARDYLAAFNADPSFREPLEGLVRLLERRRSLRNLGKLIDALVRAATSPEEKARALLMKAAFSEDVSAEVEPAKHAAREAADLGTDGPETALAWLTLELIAAKTSDAPLREEALVERAKRAGDTTWRALLLLDVGRLAAASGETDRALSLFEEARKLDAGASFAASATAARLIRSEPGLAGTDEAKGRLRAYASTLEAQADLIREALADGARGDALGVPLWARDVTHMIDAWLRAAQAHRLAGETAAAASVIDRALHTITDSPGQGLGVVEMAVVNARIRMAELMGDTARAAELAEKRLTTETDPKIAAALAMRVAEHAASDGDATRALAALSRAIEKDPACVPARALQLDLLADGGDSAAFASQLEAYAEHLENEEARGRAFLLAAYVWGMKDGRSPPGQPGSPDAAGARAALSQAAMYGIPPGTVSRFARAMASVRGDAAWHEEATRRLIASGADERELPSLWFELVRARLARGDGDGAAKALAELGATPKGAWLARVIEAFSPPALSDTSGEPTGPEGVGGNVRRRVALEELSALEPDAARAQSMSLVAAMRAHEANDLDSARARLRSIISTEPSNALVATYLAGLERAGGSPGNAATVAAACAAATSDAELGAALFLEAGFQRWRQGDRSGAIEAFGEAARGAPAAAKSVLGWAQRGLDTESVEGRRRALEQAIDAGADASVVALDRFATELGGGDPDEAASALGALERGADGDLLTAAALARLSWSLGASDQDALRAAIARIGATGEQANAIAAAEQLRLARNSDPEGLPEAARTWLESGGGLAAALEWVASTMGTDAESEARRSVGALFAGEHKEQILASATMLQHVAKPDETEVHFIEGDSAAVRLANLELAPPGSDPRRRAKALVALNGTLGNETEIDALALAGWSLLTTGDSENAMKAFAQATKARPDDLCSWEGLHAAADLTQDKARRADAAEEIGARSAEPQRGAMYWEEAALTRLELGEGDRAEAALDQSFARDPTRPVAFDKLFRRVRERKDGEKLLELVTRRLEVSEDPTEMVKLYWERSRVMRERGDVDQALEALENVTMVEPDHVGALALAGEIFIRKGRYEEAADVLGRLAKVEAAPAKNRVTAGVAAVDLYENKLNRFDLALDVLAALHKAKLSTLPVRERLARAAARTGAWQEASAILEELMIERPTTEGRIEAAQLAMAIHRDRLNDMNGARASVVKLLEESPANGDAIDLLLMTDHEPAVRKRLLEGARAGILAALATTPTDGVNVRRLANVAQALGDSPLEQAALASASVLGANDAEGQLALGQIASKKPRVPQIAFTDAMVKTVLAPGDEGPLAQLFTALGPTLAEALGPTLAATGVTKKDRVDPRSGLALRNEIAAWAGAFGIKEFELYVGGREPLGVQGVPGEPHSIVVGSGINAPLTGLVRGRIARELFAMARGTTVLRSRDETTIAAIVIAACKLAEVKIDSPPYAVLAEVEKLLSKALARRVRKLIPELCQQIASSRADARVWAKSALASHDRVAAVASGDVGLVLAETLGQPIDRLKVAMVGDARGENLIRFVLSKPYLDLRRSLGLEGVS